MQPAYSPKRFPDDINDWTDNTPHTPEHVTFKWMPGDKWDRSRDDRKLYVLLGDKWMPLSMVDWAFAFEFLAHNEERLYPPPNHGWLKWRKFMQTAYVQGWQAARTQLHIERAQRALRLETDE